MPRARRTSQLSPRETEILCLVADGLSNKEIGGRLEISVETVKAHLVRTFHKLDVPDRTAAVARALRLRWLE